MSKPFQDTNAPPERLVKISSSILLCLLILPSLVMLGLRQSSMAAGLSLSFAFIGLSAFLHWLWRPAKFRVSAGLTWATWFALISLGVLIHGIAALLLYPGFDTARFVGSYALLLLMLLASSIFVVEGQRLDASVMHRLVDIALWALALNAIAGILGIKLFSYSTFKPVGLFSEPSHFALVLGPFLAFKCAARTRFHRWLLVAFFCWGLAIENLTTLLVVVLCYLITIRLKFTHLLIIAFLATGASLLNFEYFASRLLISPESENLSVLVLLQGFENAQILLEETKYMGAGFQQFGVFGNTGEITDRMSEFGEGALNLLDGGTTASKLMGEFGALGIALTLAYLVLFISVARRLRRGCEVGSQDFGLFMHCCMYTFFIELFARGVGYFSPTAFLALSASLYMLTQPNRDKAIS